MTRPTLPHRVATALLDWLSQPARPTALPRPGPRWGPCPERPERGPLDRGGALNAWRGGWALAAPVLAPLLPWWPASWVQASHRAWLTDVREHAALMDSPSAVAQHALRLRQALHLGLSLDNVTEALGLVAAAVHQASGQTLHDAQLLAARWMLDEHLVEMATGEGKTWAMAATALVAGMAGVPVHVITSNDYLAERDARALDTIARQLGLEVGCIVSSTSPEERRAAYRKDIVFAPAREVAFDHLRDRLAARAASGTSQPPLMRGLCWALLDEADSILLDEACVPLVISMPSAQAAAGQASRRALWWQALRLAQGLTTPEHAVVDDASRVARLTMAGRALLAERARPLGGAWRRERLRGELVATALTALHALRRDRDYLVRDDKIELLDSLTGRVAEGRVWSQGLQTLVEMKEQCTPTAASETVAQITFQRFFRRYWRLAGLSATLSEARGELRGLVGLDLVRLPRGRASQRVNGPFRMFDSAQARWQAVAERAGALQARGRPVLIGTDSVADADALSTLLGQAGIEHSVLHARHDAQEATLVAQAGASGRVTVSTRMAGRGTDIQPDARALAAGGLHVINCQRNASHRHDRQLAGRCARQGQPGSAETWICAANSADHAPPHPSKLARCCSSPCSSSKRPPAWWIPWRVRLSQWLDEQRQTAWRRLLLEQDRQWEQQHLLARKPPGSA